MAWPLRVLILSIISRLSWGYSLARVVLSGAIFAITTVCRDPDSEWILGSWKNYNKPSINWKEVARRGAQKDRGQSSPLYPKAATLAQKKTQALDNHSMKAHQNVEEQSDSRRSIKAPFEQDQFTLIDDSPAFEKTARRLSYSKALGGNNEAVPVQGLMKQVPQLAQTNHTSRAKENVTLHPQTRAMNVQAQDVQFQSATTAGGISRKRSFDQKESSEDLDKAAFKKRSIPEMNTAKATPSTAARPSLSIIGGASSAFQSAQSVRPHKRKTFSVEHKPGQHKFLKPSPGALQTSSSSVVPNRAFAAYDPTKRKGAPTSDPPSGTKRPISLIKKAILTASKMEMQPPDTDEKFISQDALSSSFDSSRDLSIINVREAETTRKRVGAISVGRIPLRSQYSSKKKSKDENSTSNQTLVQHNKLEKLVQNEVKSMLSDEQRSYTSNCTNAEAVSSDKGQAHTILPLNNPPTQASSDKGSKEGGAVFTFAGASAQVAQANPPVSSAFTFGPVPPATTGFFVNKVETVAESIATGKPSEQSTHKQDCLSNLVPPVTLANTNPQVSITDDKKMSGFQGNATVFSLPAFSFTNNTNILAPLNDSLTAASLSKTGFTFGMPAADTSTTDSVFPSSPGLTTTKTIVVSPTSPTGSSKEGTQSSSTTTFPEVQSESNKYPHSPKAPTQATFSFGNLSSETKENSANLGNTTQPIFAFKSQSDVKKIDSPDEEPRNSGHSFAAIPTVPEQTVTTSGDSSKALFSFGSTNEAKNKPTAFPLPGTTNTAPLSLANSQTKPDNENTSNVGEKLSEPPKSVFSFGNVPSDANKTPTLLSAQPEDSLKNPFGSTLIAAKPLSFGAPSNSAVSSEKKASDSIKSNFIFGDTSKPVAPFSKQPEGAKTVTFGNPAPASVAPSFGNQSSENGKFASPFGLANPTNDKATNPFGGHSLEKDKSAAPFGGVKPTFGFQSQPPEDTKPKTLQSTVSFGFGENSTFGNQPPAAGKVSFSFGNQDSGVSKEGSMMDSPDTKLQMNDKHNGLGFGATPSVQSQGTKLTFGMGAPPFGTLAPAGSASTFGKTPPAFGTGAGSAFGAGTAPAFGGGAAPAFGAGGAPVFGAGGTPAFGGGGGTPAFGAGGAPAFGGGAPAFGAGATSSFGGAGTLTFGTGAVPASGAGGTQGFGAGSTPAFAAFGAGGTPGLQNPIFGSPTPQLKPPAIPPVFTPNEKQEATAFTFGTSGSSVPSFGGFGSSPQPMGATQGAPFGVGSGFQQAPVAPSSAGGAFALGSTKTTPARRIVKPRSRAG